MLLSICIPTYNGEKTISKSLESIFSQSFQNFEIIINDDCSSDKTEKIIKYFKNKKIRFYKNFRNIGYGDNLNTFRKNIKGEIMVLMAQDDIMLKDALKKIHNAFLINKNIGAVARPYYQFENDPLIPVRSWPPPDKNKNLIISIFDPKKLIEAVITSTYSVSCLAYRVKYLDTPFNSHVFTSQAYPFFSIFKKHKIVYLKDYVMAVGIYQSQCRHKPSIYIPSPVETWIKVFEVTLPEKKYLKVKKNCQDFVAQNYIGLVQIKNFGNYHLLFKEILIHLKYRKKSLIDWRFWFYSFVTLFIPRKILIMLVDNYKSMLLSKIISPKIKVSLSD